MSEQLPHADLASAGAPVASSLAANGLGFGTSKKNRYYWSARLWFSPCYHQTPNRYYQYASPWFSTAGQWRGNNFNGGQDFRLGFRRSARRILICCEWRDR